MYIDKTMLCSIAVCNHTCSQKTERCKKIYSSVTRNVLTYCVLPLYVPVQHMSESCATNFILSCLCALQTFVPIKQFETHLIFGQRCNFFFT